MALRPDLDPLMNPPHETDDQYVPGASSNSPPPVIEDEDWLEIAEQLVKAANDESSVFAKSRALTVAALLEASHGKNDEALAHLQDASTISPKLGLCAELFYQQAKEAGSAAHDRVSPGLLQCWESAARQAPSEAFRKHCHRMLLSELSLRERSSESAALLDRLVRAGEGDLSLELERIANRLAEEKSLSGMSYPEAWASDINLAAEILLGKKSGEDTQALRAREALGQDVLLLRAARDLKVGDIAGCLEAIEASELPAEAVLEFAAGLHGAAPGGLAERTRILWKLARRKSGRRIFRELLVTALLARDAASVALALEQVDPSSGTLQLKERLFLSAFAGQAWQISDEDLVALQDRDPIFAYALASPLNPVVVPNEASENALLAQLGAAITLRAGTASPAQRSLAEDSLRAAMAELQSRGKEPLLTAALQLDQVFAKETSASDIDALLVLSEGAQSVLGPLIRAARLEGRGLVEAAREAYGELLLGSNPLLHLAAYRGLLSVARSSTAGSQQSADSPHLPDSQQRADSHLDEVVLRELPADDVSRLASQLEYGLSSKTPRERGQYFASLFLNRFESASTEDRRSISVQLFVCAHLLDPKADTELKEKIRLALLEEDSCVSRLTHLRLIFEDLPVLDASQLQRLSSSPDVGLRALSELIKFRHGAIPSEVRADGEARQRTRLEYLQEASQALGTANVALAAEALASSYPRTNAERIGLPSDDLLREVVIDLSELELTLGGGGAGSVASAYFEDLSQQSAGESIRRFALERLAELDERKSDQRSALLWRRALSEEFQQDIGSQVRLEDLQRSFGEASQTTSQRLAEILPPGDRDVYRTVLGTASLVQSDLRTARKYLEPMLDEPAPPLLSLRGLIIIARERRDDELLERCYRKLKEQARSGLDQVSIANELALVQERRGNRDGARGALGEALTLKADSFVLRYLENYIAPNPGSAERGAQLLEFARACADPAHRASLLRDAAECFETSELWTEAAHCHELVLALEPAEFSAYNALVGIFTEQGDKEKLLAAYERRLEHVSRKSAEQLEILLRLTALSTELGENATAKRRAEQLLIDHPDCQPALHAHASLSLELGDIHAAERSLSALRRLLSPGDERLEVIRRLGAIYFEHTDQMEKAMDAYQEVLASTPGDQETSARLVEIYCRMGLAERAAQLQTQLIQNEQAPERKRSLALRLAEIYESVGKDIDRAAATLERTRKAWPLNAQVLAASIQFLDRQGDSGNRGITLSRAEKDARRNLESGNLNKELLETLACVARLSGRHAEAEACEAALCAYLGTEGSQLKPAGLHCLSPKLDGDLAPRGYPEPFRRLLQKTADAMDAAFSVDLAVLGARPLTDGALYERVQKIAETIGWPKIELFVSDSLGARCLPVSRRPPRLLIGTGIEELSGVARDYLLLRAFKLQVMGVGALSRSKEEDRFAGIIALLLLFSPNWRPPPVDARKVAKARALIEQGLARVGYDDEVPTLALEAIGTLSGNNDGLVDAPRLLANRACLVGVGDLGAVLEAMAAGEGKSLAPGGPSRFRFIDSHPEAKELLLFMTTSEFTRGRITLGLADAPELREAVRAPTAPLPSAPRPAGSRAPLPPPRPKPPPKR